MNLKTPRWKNAGIALIIGTALTLTGCSAEKAQPAAAGESAGHEHKDGQAHTESAGAAAAAPAALPAFTGSENTKEQPDGLRLMDYKLVDGVKVFEITAAVTEWETQDGKKEQVWSYNGTVPGPQIRITEGDKVQIKFTNKLPEASVIHWHGVHVPNSMDGVAGITQEAVKPGETFNYEFTATNTGTHMYHTHFNTYHQVNKGLFGSIVIEPKQKQDFDKEFTMMLSDGALGYLINGKSFPATKPFDVNVGEKVRIRLANIGNEVHPFHLHGHSFTIVAKDGHEMPLTAQYQADTVDLMPGDRYDIEFTAKEKGTWLYHCHVIPHVHGANGEDTGMIQVINVK